MIRLPYAGLAPPDFNNTDPESKGKVDFTLHTAACMQVKLAIALHAYSCCEYSALLSPRLCFVSFTIIVSVAMTAQTAYTHRNVSGMLGCWSNASSYDDFPKSADMVSAPALCVTEGTREEAM